MANTTSTAPTGETNNAELNARILKQVDYYFSDSNYPRDKFLRAEEKKHPQGYINLSELLKFNRLKQLSTDAKTIINAIKDSAVVQLNEEKTMIKRKNPIPEEDTSVPRTVYSKGWPFDSTLEKVTEFFSKSGKVLSVMMRKFGKSKNPHLKESDQKSGFKGSVLVEFSTEDEAKAVLEGSPQPDFLPEGAKLEYQTRENWQQEKREASQKYKDKREEKTKKRKAETVEPVEEPTFTKGVMVFFEGVGPDQKREDLKPLFSAYGAVAFLDFSANQESGYARFEKPEDAVKAVKGLTEDKTELGGKVPQLKVLEGEEETQYWEKVSKDKNARFKQSKGKRGGGRGGGRGSRGGGRGGRGGGRGGGGKRVKRE